MTLLRLPHARPTVILFDWHATLVDTKDAMYHAIDDVLPKLVETGLIERLVKAEDSKTVEDARLVKYVRTHHRLHPRIKVERKISRTDIFELLFGADEQAKREAHRLFDASYRQHFGAIEALEPQARRHLETLQALGVRLGVLSNRSREFMEREIDTIDGTGWRALFETMVCGDDVAARKPAPDLLLKALDNLGVAPGPGCWYVGDSTTDVVAAQLAQVTSIFYNGVGWDRNWIDKIFPGTVRHPHQPDGVIRDLPELVRTVRLFLESDGSPASTDGRLSTPD